MSFNSDEEEDSEEIKDEELLYNILVYNNLKESSNSKKNEKSESPKKEKSKSPNKINNKNSNNNNKNKNNIKKPFIVSDIFSNPYKKIKIIINAISFFDEYMMPIWCRKDVYIKFKVEGKWRIDKKYEYTDSKGLPSNNSKGFNYGALIGRIGLGEKFVVANEKCILVKKEGPLFLRQNLPKKMKIEPEGKLEIIIYDGDYMKIEDINKKIGWKENGIVGNINEKGNIKKNNYEIKNNIKINSNIEMEKELEKNLTKQLNNLRMNPSMFYEKYINTKLVGTKEYLIKKEKEEKNPLNENKTGYEFLEKYFTSYKQIQSKKKLNKNNINENISQLNEDIEYFLFNRIGTTVKGKSIITQKDNPNEIILQYLLDKKFRTYIFSSHSQFLIIKVIQDYFSKSNLIIMAIALDKDYSQEEEKI